MVGLSASDEERRQGAELVALPRRERERLVKLPPPLTRFIGRERETAAVATLLSKDDIRLVTLTGPGGVGKSRLALRAAVDVADDFADGAAFVSLAPVRGADLVLPTIVQALGASEGGDRPAEERLAAFLHGREFLLLLDNFEQVLDAGPSLADLLMACPRLKVLVTSRAPLRLSGEHAFSVPPLALPTRDAGDSRDMGSAAPKDLKTVEAIQLFVDRAQTAFAGFALTAENAAAVAAICDRTEGLPLAIELAAARMRALSPADLLARLSPRLPMLTGGPRDQPRRLRTMTDAIAWSHDLLPADAQTLFRRLGVFVGGFSLDAAGWVSGVGYPGPTPTPETRHPTPVVLDGLTTLVDGSLVQLETGPAVETRYAMLETVREYGQARLAERGEDRVVRDAHADWCIALAEQADPELSGPRQTLWFGRLETEHPNMRAALAWLLEDEDAARGLRLTNALSWFWSSRGYPREALDWMERFLAIPAAVSPFTRAIGLREAANIAQWQGGYERAARFAEESLAIFRAEDKRQRVGEGLRGLGSIAIDQGRLDAAASFLTESWETLQPIATAWDAAFATYLWGRHAAAGGQPAEAAERFAAAEAAFRQVGDRAYVAGSLGLLGTALLRLDDHVAARTAFAESLRLAEELHERIWVAWALIGAVHLAASEGRPEPAARLLGAAMAIRETIGERRNEDDLTPDLRATFMAPRYAKAREHGAALPQAIAIAEAFTIFGFPNEGTRQFHNERAGPDSLTPREVEVMRLLVDGLSDKEIAAALGISRYTASNHVTAIRDKFGAPSRAAVVAIALRDNLL